MPRKAKPRPLYSLYPWRCVHHPDRTEIEAYVEANDWEIVAVIPPTSGATAEVLADFIAGVINANQKKQDLLRSAMIALEDVMKEGKNFSTEQAADSVIARIKKCID